MSESIADVLRAAKARIATPEKWTQGAYRRNADGEKCLPKFAVCWCASAAILGASPNHDLVDRARYLFGTIITNPLIIEAWNDAPERTHAEVMEAFDRAIALAEASL